MEAARAAKASSPSRRRVWIALAIAGVVLVGALGAWWFFAPKPSSTRDDPAPEGTVLASGSFAGADSFHYASGTVQLVRQADGAHVLRFEDYDARAGPDVYFWLTPATAASGVGDVEADGVELATPGGFMGGQATLRGNFNVPLPADFDPAAWGGVVAWCNSYDVLFNFAPLQ